MRFSPALGCAALMVSCTGNVADSDGDFLENGTAEATSDLEATSPAPGGEATAPEAMLPRWHAYLRGQDGTSFPFAPTPGALDHHGGVVACREGDEARPERWVSLSLVEHWKHGDHYFDDLVVSGALTAVDLLMIAADLDQHGAELPPLPRAARVREDRGDWSPFPGFPGSPTGPGAGTATPGLGPRPGGSGRQPGHAGPPPRPHGHPPWRPSKPAGASAEQRAAEQARRNGVEAGDPEPVPSPFDVGWRPGAREAPEVFKCEGGVFLGFRRACPDFQGGPAGVKWTAKIKGWAARTFDPKNIAKLQPADKEQLCKLGFDAAIVTSCTLTALGCSVGEVVTVGGVTVPCWALATVLCVGTDKTVGRILDCHQWAYR